MKRTAFLLALMCGGIHTSAHGQNDDEARRPNIILIVSDDQGYADVGYHGSTEIRTPSIDRLAAEGVRFAAGYVTGPVCGPSRAGLITGRYQNRFGSTVNPTMDPSVPNGPPRTERTVAELLKAADYTTYAIGKWHLGTHEGLHPRDRGFDHFFGFLSGGHNYIPHQLTLEDLSAVSRKYGWYRTKLLDDGQRVSIDDYLTDELSDRAVSWIERSAEDSDPFFMYLCYNAPHTPMQAEDDELAKFEDVEPMRRRKYAAMISTMDAGIGRVLDALDRHGIADNTMVVFFSDNGGATNNGSSNAPLRGRKGDGWEGGIRVPFVMRWPDAIAAGRTYGHPMSTLDIIATAVHAAGPRAKAALFPDKPLDGVDLVPFLEDPDAGAPHDLMFWVSPPHQFAAVRGARYKLLVHHPDDEQESAEFFDLLNDPGETNDLSAEPEHADRIASMRAELDAWRRVMVPPAYPKLGSWDPATKPWRPKTTTGE